MKDLADHLDSGVSPALKQLPNIADGLQKTLTNTNLLVKSLDGGGYGENTQFNRDLGRLMVQLNEAMKARFRALADLLARDPQALIKGPAYGERAMTGMLHPWRIVVLALTTALAACTPLRPAFLIQSHPCRALRIAADQRSSSCSRLGSLGTWSAPRSCAPRRTIGWT